MCPSAALPESTLFGHRESLFAIVVGDKPSSFFSIAHQVRNPFAGVPQIKHYDRANLYTLPKKRRINHYDLT
uniref:hypothetical protein n=1 Tax=Escherichia coli TaxID=562 RepID=UPI001F26AFF1|nr:hypothetical protein [Escherichia coli]